MKFPIEPYLEQIERWPRSGRHILAQYDDDSIVVYQAYRPAIGNFAARNGYFGGGFSLNRMSWIKPNFLWMMYRSGWGTKPGQEVVLAVRLRRDAFERILANAVHSNFVAEVYGSRQEWQAQLKTSDARLQWDPDHAPTGAKEARRAIQLGLRGDALRRYAREWVLEIEDISDFVETQRHNVEMKAALLMPSENVYPVAARETKNRLGIDTVTSIK